MNRMRIALLALVAAALLVPAGASASTVELGLPAGTTAAPAAPPSCPGNPCLAVSRTSGYQAKAGSAYAPFLVPADARVVAWSIALGNPNAKQTSFFDGNEGGPSSAAISVLRPGRKLNYSLVAESPVMMLQPFFGTTVQFPLDTTLAAPKGDMIALTVPTWAPALALGFGSDNSWRASRPRKSCSDTTAQTAHTTIGSTIQYICLYRTARLTYGVTLVTVPKAPGATTPPKKTTGRTPTRRTTRRTPTRR